MYGPQDIAVIGMACRFPGSESIDAFWNLLYDGRTVDQPVPSQRLPLEGHWRNPAGLNQRGYFVNDVDMFDHKFFGVSAREATAMDPQQRLLLETAYQTLESAGYFVSKDRSADVGCYIGGFSQDYNDNTASHRANAFSALGTLKGFQSGRISHFFRWTGPSLTIDTVCSSSGVAIDAACKALRAGDCQSALAGGVSLFTSPFFYQNLASASFLSPEARIKAFDASADGYARSEGVGLVLLKPVAAARQAGDPILGVLRASMVRQSSALNITVPHSPSQAMLYRRLLHQAGVDPHEVTYIETHGTGTRIGDVPEYEAIQQVFGGPQRQHTLHFASLKGNIGHTEGASGVASLIKTLLMMQHGLIPPHVNFKTLNPRIKLAREKLEIPTNVQPWKLPPSMSRIAVVNNFGAAGSISALVVEGTEQPSQPSLLWTRYPVCLTAHTPSSLRSFCEALIRYLHCDDIPLGSLCFTLFRRTNHTLPVRRCFAVSSCDELRDNLRQIIDDMRSPVDQKLTDRDVRPVVLFFGGQSSRYVHVPRELADSCTVFRSHLEACDETLAKLQYPRIIPNIFDDTERTSALTLQTMQFAVQYCCAQSWIDCGLSIDCLLGHSFGQLVAFVVSGYLSLEDGFRFVCGRASLIDRQWGNDKGSMVSIQADFKTVEAIRHAVQASNPSYQLEIACHNGPNSHVLVGSSTEVSTLVTVLEQQFPSVRYKTLNVSHAFHSKLTDPILDDLGTLASTLAFRGPTIHLEMCREKLADGPLTADALVEHTRNPVFFAQAVDRIQQQLGACMWIEAGSKSIGMLRSALQDSGSHTFHSTLLNHDSIADITAQLWSCGHEVSFWPFHLRQASNFSLLQLPPYQFEKMRHWLQWGLTCQTENKDQSQMADSAAANDLLILLTDGPSSSFRVNTDSPEWCSLVLGHRVLGQPTVPASVYLDLVIRAIRRLDNQTNKNFMPRIVAFHIYSPLGLSQGEQVAVHLDRDPDVGLAWQFTYKKGSTHPSITAVGRIVLLPQTSEDMAEFAQTGRLLKMYQGTRDSPAGERNNILQQPIIYALFSQSVHYEPYYHALHDASFNKNTLRASVRFSGDQDIARQGTILSLPLDSCIQAAGLHALSLGCAEQPASLFVCSSIDRILFRDMAMSASKNGFEIFATIDIVMATDLAYDVFAFDGTTNEVLIILSGVRFRRVSRLNHVALNRENPLQQTVHSTPHHNEDSYQYHGNTIKLKHLVSDLTDIPVKEICHSSRLSTLGIDSLMMADVQREIHGRLNVTLSLEDLQVNNFGELVNLIHKRTGQVDTDQAPTLPAGDTSQHRYDYSQLEGILRQHIDVPEAIDSSCQLVDLGVDSLLAMEILNDIKQECNVHIDSTKVTPETTMGELCAFLTHQSSSEPSRGPMTCTSDVSCKSESPDGENAWITPPQDALNLTNRTIPTIEAESECIGFWKNVCPLQMQLLQAYILEAYEELGARLQSLSKGQPVPNIPISPKYEQLRIVLLNILRDGEIVDFNGETYIRSDQPNIVAPSSTLHSRMMDEFPQYHLETKLLRVTGPRLARFLKGEDDPLQHLFGDSDTKHLLEELYTNSPMFLFMSKLLAHFLSNAAANHNSSRPLRVLEIGAGTGGTTGCVLDKLAETGVPFEYVFTDISPSLVSFGKRKFGHRKDAMMHFSVLDIEQPVPKDMHGKFDVVISTLCIHATRNITRSLQNIRQLLRRDGFVALAEFTREIPWLNLVFGLLDGWWLHDDARQHALAHVALWHQEMTNAGFEQVDATGGLSPESQTGRIVCAFQSASNKPSSPKNHNDRRLSDIESETICFKHSDVHLRADIYYPRNVVVLPAQKMPMGKLFGTISPQITK